MKRATPQLAISAALALAALPAFAQEKNPDRNAYFGETQIHTSWSVDAWIFGNRITGPNEALKYAQGETIKHPLGYDIKIDTPWTSWASLTTRSTSVSPRKPIRPVRR
jgi:hypothetical protein